MVLRTQCESCTDIVRQIEAASERIFHSDTVHMYCWTFTAKHCVDTHRNTAVTCFHFPLRVLRILPISPTEYFMATRCEIINYGTLIRDSIVTGASNRPVLVCMCHWLPQNLWGKHLNTTLPTANSLKTKLNSDRREQKSACKVT